MKITNVEVEVIFQFKNKVFQEDGSVIKRQKYDNTDQIHGYRGWKIEK